MEKLGFNCVDEKVSSYLPYLFTDWQIKILRKRFSGEKFTASERGEFTKIKRKIRAISKLQCLRLLVEDW